MTEEEKIDPEYLKGFNEGYTINKYKPELAENIIKAIGNSQRSLGFTDGWKEFQIEKSRDLNLSFDQNREKDRSDIEKRKEKDLDKDDI